MSGPWVAAFITLTVLVLLLTVTVIGLMRRTALVLERAESAISTLPGPGVAMGVGPGTEVPAFETTNSAGDRWRSHRERGRPRVMLFVDAGCAPCERLINEIQASPVSLGDAELVMVTREPDGRLSDLGNRYTVLMDTDGAVSEAFGTSITPNAFAVDADGVVVAREVPASAEALARLAGALSVMSDDALERGSSTSHDRARGARIGRGDVDGDAHD